MEEVNETQSTVRVRWPGREACHGIDLTSKFNCGPCFRSGVKATRRYWGGVGVGLTLTGLALLLAQPIFLVGAGGVFAWLLGAQIAFTRALKRLNDSLVIEQAFVRPAVAVDEPVTAIISVEGEARGLDITVKARPSAGLDVQETLGGPIRNPIIGEMSSPVAGTHTLHPPELTIEDTSGLFVERLRRGPEHELRVEPRKPSRVHVGEGGDAVPIAFGEHAVDSTGSGLIPAELREYVAGEAASRIDWKATARLATPHVREYEAESDLTTMLIVDYRGQLDVGPEGETILDYLRTAAIGYLGVAKSIGDPVGCFGVADETVQRLATPSNAPRAYERIHRQLTALEATENGKEGRAIEPIPQRASSLDTDSEFGQTLAQFATSDGMATHTADPLVSAVRAATSAQQGTLQVAIFTDDSGRAALKDAIRAARRGENHVFAFIAPQVCFEPDMLADLHKASERYRDFERFRTELASIEGVRSFEIAPRDRMEALLESQAEPNR